MPEILSQWVSSSQLKAASRKENQRKFLSEPRKKKRKERGREGRRQGGEKEGGREEGRKELEEESKFLADRKPALGMETIWSKWLSTLNLSCNNMEWASLLSKLHICVWWCPFRFYQEHSNSFLNLGKQPDRHGDTARSLLWVQLRDKSGSIFFIRYWDKAAPLPRLKQGALHVGHSNYRRKTVGSKLERENISATRSVCVLCSTSHALKTMEHFYTKIGMRWCRHECQLVVCCINTN